MDWTSIAVAVIMAGGSAIGSLYGIKKSNDLVDYRMNELTREVRKHNDFANRIPVIEEKLKVANHRIDDLEDDIK